MNVLFHFASGPDLAARLAAIPGLNITVCPEQDELLLARLLPETEILWHVLKRCTAEMIVAAPRLRLIQKIGVGVNTIDLDAARKRGVAVCNMPGTNSQAVAELALMLMLASLRRVAYFDPLTRRGEGWRPEPEQFDRVGELAGRTVGLVGFGAIPQRLAPVLRALGAEVIHTTATKRDGAVPLDELLARSDVVSLHCPATPDTIGMISRDAIARMKPGAVLVNTARGELVDETALYDALHTGHLRAAGLDVFQREPAPQDNPLFTLPNVVVTPHVGWLTPETLSRSIAIGFENCRRVRSGEPLLHCVV